MTTPHHRYDDAGTAHDDAVPRPPWQDAPPTVTHRGQWSRPVDADAPLLTRRGAETVRPASHGRADRARTTELDRIVPASVDRRAPDYVRVGQSYVRVFAVLELPRAVAPGALARLMRFPGVQTSVVNHPIAKGAAKTFLQGIAKHMGEAIDQQQQAETASDEVQARTDARRVLSAITQEQSGLHLVGIYLALAAADLPALNQASVALQTTATDVQVTLIAADLQHWDGMLTTLPLGTDELRYLFPTDTPTLARLFPTATGAVRAGAGIPILYGVRAEGNGRGQQMGAPVLVDRRKLTSRQKTTIAATGRGKTYHESAVLLQHFAHGDVDLIVLDPKDQEYRDLIQDSLGGTYLVLSERSEITLNPLSLPYGDSQVVARIQESDTDLLSQRAALITQLVSGESQARGRPLSGRAEAELETAVRACYAQRGITSDPTTFHAAVPDLRSVAAYLAEREAPVELCDALVLFTEGVLGGLLHGGKPLPRQTPPSTLRDDVGVLGVDLSSFVYGRNETLRRVIPTLLADYLITLVMTGRKRAVELLIDEGWVFLDTPAGGRTIETIGRVGRSLELGCTLVTQQIRELLYRKVGDTEIPNHAGRAWLENCETILLLGQIRAPKADAASDPDGNPVLLAAKTLGLTPGETAWLSECNLDADRSGSTGLLLLGRDAIPLRIPRMPGAIHQRIPGVGGAASGLAREG